MGAAASMFGGLDRRTTEGIIKQTLEGHQRSMVGNITAKELLEDQQVFSDEVNFSARVDLIGLGVTIINFVLTLIDDNVGYKESLGKSKTSEKVNQARIATAENQMKAQEKEAQTNRDTEVNRFRNQTVEEESRKTYHLKKATNDKETNKKKVIADYAERRKAMATAQKKVELEQKTAITAKTQEIRFAHADVDRAKQTLEGDIIKPALAESYGIATQAQAKKYQLDSRTHADAAEARLVGVANADAIRVKGDAEAEAMGLKAKAWTKYSRGTFLDKIIQQTPLIAAVSVHVVVRATHSVAVFHHRSGCDFGVAGRFAGSG